MPPAERSALYDRTLTSDSTRTAPTLLATHYSEIQWFWITLAIQLLRCLLMLMCGDDPANVWDDKCGE